MWQKGWVCGGGEGSEGGQQEEGVRGGVRGARLALSPALTCVRPCTRIYLPGFGLLFVNRVQHFPVSYPED